MSGIDLDSLGLALAPEFLGVLGGFERVLSGNVVFTAPAPSGPYSNIYAFGDSLSDDGNTYILSGGLEPVSPPYDADFSNGPVWVEDLAASLGLPAPGPSLAGGTDFAYGGAETGNDPLHAATAADLPGQLAQFEQADPHPSPNALYTVWAGSNDVLDAVTDFSTSPSEAIADVQAAVNNEANFVLGLAADGAKNVLVLNVPDLGKTPATMDGGPITAAVASGLSALFDIELAGAMRAVAAEAHLNLHIVDTYSLIDAAVAHPAAFGLSNVTQPVWTGNYTSASSGTLASTNPAVQNRYLFWDSLHPTAHGQAVVAQAALASLAG